MIRHLTFRVFWWDRPTALQPSDVEIEDPNLIEAAHLAYGHHFEPVLGLVVGKVT